MKKLVLVVVAIAALSMVAVADTVDQSDLTNNAYMAAFSQSDLAQSFTPSANNVSGAGIQLFYGAPGVTISLWDKLPNAGGTQLASATSGPANDGQWVDVFWSPVAVTPGQTYYLVFTSIGNAGGIAGDVNNGYPGGMVFANPGYQPFPGFDYTFREYTGAATPEPASLALLGTGAAFLLRRFRKA